jgi:hypothetical protein
VRSSNPVRRALLWQSALAILWLPFSARAQLSLGPLEDATVLPPGAFRFGGFFEFASANERFGENTPGLSAGTREPLATDFMVGGLTTAQFPRLAPFEEQIRQASGLSAFMLTLGSPFVRSDVGIATLPVMLDVGILPRVMVGVTVPYVKTRNTVAYFPGDGTAGMNPGSVAGPARVENTAFRNQITQASADLQAQLDFCAVNPTSGNCPTLNANRDEANALIAESRLLRDQVERVYGSDTAIGFSPVVPRAGSAAQLAIDARAESMSALYRSLLGLAAEPITARPFPAQTPLTDPQLQTLVTSADPLFGIQAVGLGSAARSHVGDIEAGVKVLVLDGFRDGRGVRLAVGGAFRFATGREDDPDDFFDVPTGDGQNDIDLRSVLDLGLGSRLMLSARGRYVIQLPDQDIARITDAPGDILPAAYRSQQVDRDLGDIIELDAAPRIAIGRFFRVVGQYTFRHRAADEYEGRFTIPDIVTGIGDVELDASTLGLETKSVEHRVAIGFTFSTFAAPRRRWPFEVAYTHAWTVDGTGNQLALTRDMFQVRIYSPRSVR